NYLLIVPPGHADSLPAARAAPFARSSVLLRLSVFNSRFLHPWPACASGLSPPLPRVAACADGSPEKALALAVRNRGALGGPFETDNSFWRTRHEQRTSENEPRRGDPLRKYQRGHLAKRRQERKLVHSDLPARVSR